MTWPIRLPCGSSRMCGAASSATIFHADAPANVQATLGDSNGSPETLVNRLSEAMQELSDGGVADAARATAGPNATAVEVNAAVAPAAMELYTRRIVAGSIIPDR